MRVLIISKGAAGASTAYKLSKEGHHVDLWIDDKEYKDTLKGYVNRPASWRPLVASADLIICDMIGFSEHAALFQRLGKPFIGCNPITDVLEFDHQRSMSTFHKLGINTLPSQDYKNVEEASQLNWVNEPGYLLKAGVDISYECETEEIYQWALTTLKQSGVITVQELMPDEGSVEVNTEGWFNGIDWIHPFSHIFEDDDQDGSVLLTVDKPNKLIEATIARFKPILAKAGYRGLIDIECIVTKDKIYATELTCHPDYNSFDAMMTGLNEPVGAFLFDVATGIKKSMNIRSDFLICVPVSVESDALSKGMPISGLNETDLRFTYLCDVYKDGNQMKYAASNGTILKATAFGRSVKEAQHRVYKICKNIKALNIEYSDDVGDRVDKDIALLREWKWL